MENFVSVASHHIPQFFTPKNNCIKNIITVRYNNIHYNGLKLLSIALKSWSTQCKKAKDWRGHMVTVAFINEVMELKSMCSSFVRMKPQMAELQSFEWVKIIYPYWGAAPVNINPCYARIKGSFCANSFPLNSKGWAERSVIRWKPSDWLYVFCCKSHRFL